MRILLVSARYLPHHGGVETVVHEIASQMRLDGHTVQIVTQRVPHTLPRHEVLDGIQVIRLLFLYPGWRLVKHGKLALWLAGCVVFPLILAQFYALVRRFRPDVINFHYVGTPALFVWLLSHLYRVPLIVSLHGGDVDYEPLQDRFIRWLFKAVLRRAAQVTACSKALLAKALELSPESAPKAHVIYNGVDAALFAAIPAYDHPRPYVCAVGQLARHKGFDSLIEAFSQTAQEYSDLDLLIAGDGKEKEALQRQIQAAGLGARAFLLGGVSHDQVAALMRGSRLVAIPSRREPFGIVGLEAMASGRPIIARRVDGLIEALDGAIVTWVDGDNPASLADAIRKTLSSAECDRLLESNQQEAQSHSWQTITEQYVTTPPAKAGGFSAYACANALR